MKNTPSWVRWRIERPLRQPVNSQSTGLGRANRKLRQGLRSVCATESTGGCDSGTLGFGTPQSYS